MKSWVLTQTAPHRYVIGGKISLFLVEKQCRMAKMTIVRVLLFLVLLAGEYQLSICFHRSTLHSADGSQQTKPPMRNKCPSPG